MSDEVKVGIAVFQIVCAVFQIALALKVMRISNSNKNLLDTVKKTNAETKKLLESIPQPNIPSPIFNMKIVGACSYCKEMKPIHIMTYRCDDCAERPTPEEAKQPKYRSIDDPWEKK